MTSEVACDEFLHHHLTALDWIDRGETIACDLGNNQSMNKMFIDSGELAVAIGDREGAKAVYRDALEAAVTAPICC